MNETTYRVVPNPQYLDMYEHFWPQHQCIGWLEVSTPTSFISRLIVKMKPGYKAWTPYGCVRDCGDHYILAEYDRFDSLDKKTMKITHDVGDR